MTERHIYLPQAGDIVHLDLDPQVGREQSGWRPCLVLSDQSLASKNMLAMICPITRTIKDEYFMIRLTGTKTKGSVITTGARVVDVEARGIKFIEQAPDEVVRACRLFVHMIVGEEN